MRPRQWAVGGCGGGGGGGSGGDVGSGRGISAAFILSDFRFSRKGETDRQTDLRTDGPTERPSY